MSEFPETSHSLIFRVKNPADGAAWTEFLGIYQPVVCRMARRRGLQDADAQDVLPGRCMSRGIESSPG
jgi:RNA polymerase sigma-70 factor, ECF subfamily